MRRVIARTRGFVRRNILHLDDTPHRIALGVFLGFFVGATPTIGVQMIIYIIIAWMLRANKVSGLGPVWLSNPFTAVPLYYFNWRVGSLFFRGQVSDGAGDQLEARLRAAAAAEGSLWDIGYWRELGHVFFELGIELWVGSMIVGVVLGTIGYGLTFRTIVRFRAAKANRRAAHLARQAALAAPSEDPPAAPGSEHQDR